MSDAKIDRAEARLRQQRAEYEEWLREPCYRGLSAAELIALAKSPKRLKTEELMALDEAWLEKFGERLTDAIETNGSAERPQLAQQGEPATQSLEELDDDDLITRRRSGAEAERHAQHSAEHGRGRPAA